MTNVTRYTLHDLRIVCIGGGTGMPLVLKALQPHGVHLSAIVAMADNGGSTGFLRKQYGTLPTGDVRRALAALAEADSPLKSLMTYRFKGGPLDQQSAGSIFLTSLENAMGSFEKAIDATAKLLDIKGDVIPVTLDSSQLYARLSNGTVIMGETDIDIPKHDGTAIIEKLWLEPESSANPRAIAAIEKADAIIIGPGDIYTSLIPNLLVAGIPEAIKKSQAKKIYIANLITKFGETQNFKAEDFFHAIEEYMSIDAAIFNTRKPSVAMLKKYTAEKAKFVEPPLKKDSRFILADVLADGDFIRHDSGEKLARVIL